MDAERNEQSDDEAVESAKRLAKLAAARLGALLAAGAITVFALTSVGHFRAAQNRIERNKKAAEVQPEKKDSETKKVQEEKEEKQ